MAEHRNGFGHGLTAPAAVVDAPVPPVPRPDRTAALIMPAAYFAFAIGYVHRRARPVLALIAGLAAANIALYYKEPVFITLGAFAFVHLLLGWPSASRSEKLFDGLVLVSCAIYMSVYCLLVQIHRADVGYAEIHRTSIATVVKYFTVRDPLLVLCLIPLTLRRIWPGFPISMVIRTTLGTSGGGWCCPSGSTRGRSPACNSVSSRPAGAW